MTKKEIEEELRITRKRLAECKNKYEILRGKLTQISKSNE